MGTSLVWLRDDLRLVDNPALHAACGRGGKVAVVYILDEQSTGIRPLGGATKWWLHKSLAALDLSLKAIGSTLVLRRGKAFDVVGDLVSEMKVEGVFWNRRYGSAERAIDGQIKAALTNQGLEVASFHANLLFEPWEIKTGSGTPYKVFTPFWRACTDRSEPRHPLPASSFIDAVHADSDVLSSWSLLPKPDWAAGLSAEWAPGEDGAERRLAEFCDRGGAGYAVDRDKPAVEATSRLSPHLRFGEISPFRIWHAIRSVQGGAAEDLAVFRTELGWREFCWQLLYFHPHLAAVNYRRKFDAFQWQTPSPGELAAWQQGRTGYPLVDAGMRQLWQTGWMHNRIRMVVASFLVKNLLVDWRVGEQWFWDTLVDADAANNPANWQWVAGSGADAAPYFRVFNPITQSRKFDPDGAYLRQFVAELAGLGPKAIHEPWKGPHSQDGNKKYPPPIVELAPSRERALDAYAALEDPL
ncbi:cryptochrome/photolyase family protein [Arthrobacter sp. A5]|uniref:cryptochrome/photolyase family protein n=1 Tax=Arthrobacter sp. A5 TaxID=576926 RepID=UPI003DA91C1B